MSQYARQARSSWFECGICGEDFPQTEAIRHYKFGVLVDAKCADELAFTDYYDDLRLPDTERPNPTMQRVPDQGTVTEDYGFFFSQTHFDTGKFRMTAGPIIDQEPQ